MWLFLCGLSIGVIVGIFIGLLCLILGDKDE